MRRTIWLRGVAVVLAGIGVAWSSCSGQTARAGGAESRATAVVEGASIRFRLPLKAVGEGSMLAAQLLDPKGESVAEVRQPVRAGATGGELLLPYPMDKKGEPVEAVEWFRVAYRLEAEGQAEVRGSYSLGEITENLIQLMVARPEKPLEAGKPYGVRVYAGHPVTHKPIPGVLIVATLAWDEPGAVERKLARTAATDRSGEAVLSFTLARTPAGVPAQARLTVVGTARGGHGELATSRLESELNATRTGQVGIELDKPIYRPGQTVHVRALASTELGKPAVRAPLNLAIEDPVGKTIAEAALESDRFGVAVYDWKLGEGIERGRYRLLLRFADPKAKEEAGRAGSFSTLIPVEHYELPEFIVSAGLDRGYYVAGQRPEITVRARFRDGKPVAGGLVRLAREAERSWSQRVGQEEVAVERGALDTEGVAKFSPDFKEELAAVPEESGLRYRDLSLVALVTDPATGQTEARRFNLRITGAPIHMTLRQTGGDARSGEFVLHTVYADGEPAAGKVTVAQVGQEGAAPEALAVVETSRYGLARIHLEYPSGGLDAKRLKLRLTASDSQGREGQLEQTVYPLAVRPVWIELKKVVLKPGEAIQAAVHGPADQALELDLLGAEGSLAQRRLTMVNGRAEVTLPFDGRFHGAVTLAVYGLGGAEPNSGAATVFYPEEKGLRLRLDGLPRSGLAAGVVGGRFRVTDTAGQGVLAEIGVAVTNQAVEERAAEEFEEPDFAGEGENRQKKTVGGLTMEDLNRLDLKRALPEGIDLVAEELLGATDPVWIESNADTAARGQLSAGMEAQLAPLGKALEEAELERLTAAPEPIEAAARAAQVELEDAWGRPYRAQAEAVAGADVLSMVSAGPDQRFGTGDDFVLPVARQSFFARPGRMLDELLQKAATANEPLPGTAEQLMEWSKQRGLDLAALHDPLGRPFVFAVRPEGRGVSVGVALGASEGLLGGVDEGQTVGSGPAIWQSAPLGTVLPLEETAGQALEGAAAALPTVLRPAGAGVASERSRSARAPIREKAPLPIGEKASGQPQVTPRRPVEETAWWQPTMKTDAQGWATFRFKLPEGLATWTLRAVASTLDGRTQTVEWSLPAK